MPAIDLTDDEMVTLREAFDDVGNDCPGVDWDKFKALGVKLGFWEPDPPETLEEIARREAYANSPAGKMFRELLAQTNKNLVEKYVKDIEFYDGSQWAVGNQLRIKLPNDYTIANKDKK